MPDRKTFLILLSVLLAVGGPLLLILKAESDRKSAPVVRFAVEPYDPRDLLYGQYLRFAIDWNWKGGTPAQNICPGGECCLCVGDGAADPEVSLAQCPPRGAMLPACAHTLRGTYFGGEQFDIGVDRYFVSETLALPLEKLFFEKKEKFSIGLGLRESGRPVLHDLYVGEQTLPGYIDAHDGRIPDGNAAP